METKPTKRCGLLQPLVTTGDVTVRRCDCGTIHVGMHTHAIELRMSSKDFRHLANAIGAAARVLDYVEPAPAPSPVVGSGPSN